MHFKQPNRVIFDFQHVSSTNLSFETELKSGQAFFATNYLWRLKKNQFFSNFSYFKNFTDKDLTIYFSLAAFFILTVSLFLALYMHFYNYKISSKLGFEFSRKLFDIYLKKNTLFFANHSSIEINKNINFEVSRLVDKVIQPVFRMIAKSFLIISMIFVMLVYNTKITLLSSFAIVVYYFIFNIFIK